MTSLLRALTLSTFCFFACTNESKKPSITETSADTAKDGAGVKNSSIMPAYDAATDGMLIAPSMTRILGDTLGVKFYEVSMKPGDSIGLHQHPDHVFYVIDGGRAAIYFGHDRQEWDLTPGTSLVSGPVSDAAKNIGKTTIKFLIVDIYRPRQN